MQIFNRWVLVFLLIHLVGCKEPLYTQLSEQEANEIVAVLARSGLDAAKEPRGEKNWGVQVRSSDMAAAVEALSAAGLPKQRYSNLGDLFRREGIVATPTEERVRFVHGVSQELSSTLTTIDGVLAARVHLVIPHNDPLADKAKVGSASVFLKHRPDVDLQPMLPAIKSLVVRSVEGLSHETVFVTMVPAVRAGGHAVGSSPVSDSRIPFMLAGVIVAVGLLAFVAYWAFGPRLGLTRRTGLLTPFRDKRVKRSTSSESLSDIAAASATSGNPSSTRSRSSRRPPMV